MCEGEQCLQTLQPRGALWARGCQLPAWRELQRVEERQELRWARGRKGPSLRTPADSGRPTGRLEAGKHRHPPVFGETILLWLLRRESGCRDEIGDVKEATTVMTGWGWGVAHGWGQRGGGGQEETRND